MKYFIAVHVQDGVLSDVIFLGCPKGINISELMKSGTISDVASVVGTANGHALK